MFKRGLFALSGDPMTYGHLDIIKRAAAQCERLVVAIANNDAKLGSYLFSLEERLEIARRAIALASITNVDVVGTSALLADVYLYENCDALFRGVRNDEDMKFERMQMTLHGMILPDMLKNVVLMEADPKFVHISSTVVKAIAARNLDTSTFVPVFVKRMLEERICKQHFIGVTGEIASGKTYVAAELVKTLAARGIAATHVNLDAIQREVYAETSPGADHVRAELGRLFGPDVLANEGRDVHTKLLATRLFDEHCAPELRAQVQALVTPHVMRKYREIVAPLKGVVILEWAQLAEMHLGSWANHNVIVVSSPDRDHNLAQRGIDGARRAQMAHLQWNTQRKLDSLQAAATRDGTGTTVHYENRRGSDASPLADAVCEILNLHP